MAIILIRTLILFLSLILAMRLMGKRQLGELELSELVVAVLVADIASIPLQNPSLPLSYGLIPLLVLFCCELDHLRPDLPEHSVCASCSTAGRTSSSSAGTSPSRPCTATASRSTS
ncbi:MAG: hypothetical protein ACLUNO_06445 [Oscillospiraceae bacterium]